MLLRLLVILLFSFLTSVLSYGQGPENMQEYELKAKYVLNMPILTDMPSLALNNVSYTVCLIGDTPLETILLASNGKLIRNRALSIRKVDNISQGDNCQMLFIASSARYRLQPLLAAAGRRGILTISDMKDFARLGGMIGLLIVDNRLTFDINRAAAGKASVSFDSQLLNLAHDLIN